MASFISCLPLHQHNAPPGYCRQSGLAVKTKIPTKIPSQKRKARDPLTAQVFLYTGSLGLAELAVEDQRFGKPSFPVSIGSAQAC
jgi:hypothetical protein